MKWKKCLMSICGSQAHLLEKDELFDLSELIKKIIDKYNNDNVSSNISSEIFINGRKI